MGSSRRVRSDESAACMSMAESGGSTENVPSAPVQHNKQLCDTPEHLLELCSCSRHSGWGLCEETPIARPMSLIARLPGTCFNLTWQLFTQPENSQSLNAVSVTRLQERNLHTHLSNVSQSKKEHLPCTKSNAGTSSNS